MTFITLLIFGLVDLDCFRFFFVSPNEATRGHVSKLFVRDSRVDVRKYFFRRLTVLLKFGTVCQLQWKTLLVAYTKV